MQALIQLLQSKNYTLSSVESLTGGLFASELVAQAHASRVFAGSVVTYQTRIKEEVLHISKKTIAEHGVMSVACVEEMLQAGKLMFKSDIVVAFSGNAGPDAHEGKKVGYVCIGIQLHRKQFVYEEHFCGSRNEIRMQCVMYAKEKLMCLLGKYE